MPGAPTTESALGGLREWMEAHSVLATLCTDPVSIAYLTGFRAEPHERLLALVVRPAGATLVVPRLEADRAEGVAGQAEVLAWADGQNPWRMVADALGPGAADRLAVEKAHLTLAAWERLRDTWGPAGPAPADAGPLIRALRARKRPAELEALTAAAAITDRVVAEALAELRPGLAEDEVAAEVERRIRAAGAEPAFPALVQSGPNSALAHGPPGGRRLGSGDLVLLDLGAARSGYRADMTRMAVLGEPDRLQRQVHDAVLAAHEAALAAVRPGATAGQVDAAARAVIGRAGFGDRFIHRTGHGLGLEAHEAPSLEPGATTELEEGMVVTVEPGVYLPGWGGVRIEDDVVVEHDGSRLLTRAERGLRVVRIP